MAKYTVKKYGMRFYVLRGKRRISGGMSRARAEAEAEHLAWFDAHPKASTRVVLAKWSEILKKHHTVD